MRSVVTLFLLVVVTVASASDVNIRIVASVAEITPSDTLGLEGSYAWLRIHSPAEFQGLQVSLSFKGRDRGQVRSDFPIGSVWEIVLPESERATIVKEKLDEEHVQQQIDRGVSREMISQLVIGPQLGIGDLPAAPVRKSIQ